MSTRSCLVFIIIIRDFRLRRKELLLFCFFIIKAFRLGRKDLSLFCFFIRAFRLGRKDLLLLCFLIIIFFSRHIYVSILRKTM